MGPAFNRMWAASIVSNLSDGILVAAAPLLAISLTDSTILISAIGAMAMLPWLLFAIPIGTIVDRADHRFILAGSNATRSAVVGGLALLIATQHITIYWLLVAAFLIGICEVAADTTSQSLIPKLLDEKNYEKGNSRLQISETIVQGAIGSPASGFIYAIAIWLPFLINSLGFVISALLALSIPIKYLQDVRLESPQKEAKNFLAEMKFGITYLFKQVVLRRLVVTSALIGVCYSIGTSTMVLFIINELELPKPLFGVVLTIQGVGAIAGAFLAPKFSKLFGRTHMMAFGIVSSSLVLLLQAFSPNIFYFVGLATFGAFTISQWNVLLMATYQSVIPTEMYGRIHGTRRTLVWGLMPLGSITGGVLAHFGLRIPMLFGGAIATLISVFSIHFILNLKSLPTTSQS